jgi:hypothetical protein
MSVCTLTWEANRIENYNIKEGGKNVYQGCSKRNLGTGFDKIL